MVLTVMVGFTVMVKDAGVPWHALPLYVYVGVTVMVPVIGVVVLLVAANAAMLFPVPLAPSPIAVLVFDQV